MNRLTIMVVVGVLFGALAFIVSASVEDMPGSDDRAQSAVSDLTGGAHHAWMNSLWNPSSHMERLLFSLQAGIGGMLFGYFLVSLQRKKSD